MTLRHALHVLMDAAVKYQAGAGCGLRSVPSDNERDNIRLAVEKVYPKVYDRKPTEQDLRNLGLR